MIGEHTFTPSWMTEVWKMEPGGTDYCGKSEMLNPYRNNVKEKKIKKFYTTEITSRVQYNIRILSMLMRSTSIFSFEYQQ
jgi:hypothetical protein